MLLGGVPPANACSAPLLGLKPPLQGLRVHQARVLSSVEGQRTEGPGLSVLTALASGTVLMQGFYTNFCVSYRPLTTSASP